MFGLCFRAAQFLVKQKVRVNPDQFPIYAQQKSLKATREAHPQQHPPVRPILPLRPTTCMPRLSSSGDMSSTSTSTLDMALPAVSIMNPYQQLKVRHFDHRVCGYPYCGYSYCGYPYCGYSFGGYPYCDYPECGYPYGYRYCGYRYCR